MRKAIDSISPFGWCMTVSFVIGFIAGLLVNL